MFPGNNFIAPAVMAAFVICFALCFSTARNKAVTETMRWQKEARYEVSQLEKKNSVEVAGLVPPAEKVSPAGRPVSGFVEAK